MNAEMFIFRWYVNQCYVFADEYHLVDVEGSDCASFNNDYSDLCLQPTPDMSMCQTKILQEQQDEVSDLFFLLRSIYNHGRGCGNSRVRHQKY